MKKIAILLPVLLMLVSASFAQPAEVTPEGLTKNPAFRMGVSFSGVASWINPDFKTTFGEPSGARFNIGYGLHTDFGLGTSHNYYFSTGLFVLNTGGSLKYTHKFEDGIVSNRTIDYRFNYVNIPLLMMMRTNEIGYMVYFARVGFDNGFNIKSTYSSSDVLPNNQTVVDKDSSPDYASLYRSGLHIELGTEMNLTGTTNMFVSVTWNNGLNNVFSKKAEGVIPESENREMKRIKGNTNLIMVNLGVYF